MLKSKSTLVALFCSLVVLALVGCLPYALGDPAESKIDAKLNGCWIHEKDDESQLFMVAPFDDHAYVIQHVGIKKKDGATEVSGRLLWKAWITEVGGKRFLSLDLPEQQLQTTGGKHAYAAVQIVSATDDKLVTRLLNEDFQAVKTARSSEELAAVVVKEMANAALFKEEITYRRVDLEKEKELIDRAFRN